eukprot:1869289-Rhodomonas_salina.3
MAPVREYRQPTGSAHFAYRKANNSNSKSTFSVLSYQIWGRSSAQKPRTVKLSCSASAAAS